jgi:hypothetical protein
MLHLGSVHMQLLHDFDEMRKEKKVIRNRTAKMNNSNGIILFFHHRVFMYTPVLSVSNQKESRSSAKTRRFGRLNKFPEIVLLKQYFRFLKLKCDAKKN